MSCAWSADARPLRLAQHARGSPGAPCARHDDRQREHRVLLRRLVGALEALGPARAAARRRPAGRSPRSRAAWRSTLIIAAQRIGPLGRREPHHAQHDDDADQRGRRGAEPGVDQVHVVEHHAHAREQRRVVLGLQAADDRAGERPRRRRATASARPGSTRLQRRADRRGCRRARARSAAHHSRCALTAI